MRFLRILPLVWAKMTCSLSSLTRNIALGSSSVTMPLNSIISSLDKQTSSKGGTTPLKWAAARFWSSFAQTGGHRAGMRGEAFRFGQGHGGGTDGLQRAVIER